jgi:hypothetical protein
LNPNGKGKAGQSFGRRPKAWSSVFLMMALITLSLPLTPSLWRAGRQHFGRAFDALGYVVFLLIGVGIVVYLIRSRREFGALRYVGIALLALLYLYLLHRTRFPAERLHLMEYGFLAYLCWRAFRIDLSAVKSYALGFLLSSVFGIADEAIQYLLPNRHFEMRDVTMNIIASALGLLLASLLRRSNAFPLGAGKGDR